VIVRKYKIEWPNNQELQELLNGYPLSNLANLLKVSDNAIKKRARARGLIIPTDLHGKGYWLRKVIEKMDDK